MQVIDVITLQQRLLQRGRPRAGAEITQRFKGPFTGASLQRGRPRAGAEMALARDVPAGTKITSTGPPPRGGGN